jgi:hypothetical protein
MLQRGKAEWLQLLKAAQVPAGPPSALSGVCVLLWGGIHELTRCAPH